MVPQAVIFDIGNVLIEWQPEKYFDSIIGPARRREMFAEIDIHAMMVRIDAGEEFAAVIEDTAAGHPRWREHVLRFRWKWCDIAQPDIPGSVRLLLALRCKGVPVFALSNFGAQNFPLSEKQFPFLAEFDRRYISGEMGMVKPDPAIYAAVEADCGIAPSRLFFTDDRADNIAAARERGWRAHLFDGPDGLAQALANQGLLSPEELQ
ncbi:HAD-IA family hydrolase [Roseovarius salis]|uniref:HAD family hydrolase n=1 Tax=Roseovarius salis TaxID=3376063 RepID=UPI0037C779A1